MDKLLEKLWNEYLASECAGVDTKEERGLAKKVVEKHEKANELLTKEQRDAVEQYADTLYEMQAAFVKKAFFKGCEFATSFFFEFWTFKTI